MLDGAILPALARGCGVLAAGGGGDLDLAALMARQAIGDNHAVPLVDADDLPDDGLVMVCGAIGTPIPLSEKIEQGGEAGRLRDQVEDLWGRRVFALMGFEIGGWNGMLPVSWGARLGLPVLDADGTGRAFPEVQMTTMSLAGVPSAPTVITDERGNLVVLRRTADDHWTERLARAAAVELGGIAAFASYSLTVADARRATVRGSVSLAIEIGRAIEGADSDPVAALVAKLRAFQLLSGKVLDVELRTTGGFMHGSVALRGEGPDSGRTLRLDLQNENLVALARGRVVASVPDNISVLDSATGGAISTDAIRYGQRVTVLAFPSAPIWRTARGIAAVGPRAFGYDFDYQPVELLYRDRQATR